MEMLLCMVCAYVAFAQTAKYMHILVPRVYEMPTYLHKFEWLVVTASPDLFSPANLMYVRTTSIPTSSHPQSHVSVKTHCAVL